MNDTLGEDDSDGRRRSTTAPAPLYDDLRRHCTAEVSITEFTAFYHESAARLVAFLRWQGASLPDAADCAQEALTQAFARWSTLTEPYAWCRVVASRGYARHLATLRECPTDDPDQVAGAPLLPSNTDVAAFENRHHVLGLLNRLPSRQRQVMAWTYDGATPTEIADTLRITPEAVRSNLHKARTTLRDLAGERP